MAYLFLIFFFFVKSHHILVLFSHVTVLRT